MPDEPLQSITVVAGVVRVTAKFPHNGAEVVKCRAVEMSSGLLIKGLPCPRLHIAVHDTIEITIRKVPAPKPHAAAVRSVSMTAASSTP